VDLFIDDTSASRQHAEIVEKGGDFYLHDLGSTNGTYVNGHRISDKELLLHDGDKVRVPSVTLSTFSRIPDTKLSS